MSVIEIDVQALSDCILSLNKGFKHLTEASNILNSIIIPKTLTSGYLIKKICQEIDQQSIESTIKAKKFIEERANKFNEIEKKNMDIMNLLNIKTDTNTGTSISKSPTKAYVPSQDELGYGYNVLDSIKNIGSNIGSNIKSIMTNGFTNIKNTAANIAANITSRISNITDTLKNIRNIGSQIGSNVRSRLSKAINNATKSVKNIKATIGKSVKSKLSKITNSIKKGVQNIKNIGTKIGTKIKSKVTEVAKNIKNSLKNTGAKIGKVIKSGKSKFQKVVTNIKNTGAKIGKTIKSTVSKIAKNTKADIKKIGTKLNKSIKSVVAKKDTKKKNIKQPTKVNNTNSQGSVYTKKNTKTKTKTKAKTKKVEKVISNNQTTSNDKKEQEITKTMNKCKKALKDENINWKQEDIYNSKDADKVDALAGEMEKVLSKNTNVQHDGDEFRRYQVEIYHLMRDKIGDNEAAARFVTNVFTKVIDSRGGYEIVDNVDNINIHVIKNVNWNNAQTTVEDTKSMINKLPKTLRNELKDIYISDLPNPADAQMSLYYKMPDYTCSCRYTNGRKRKYF